MGEDDPIAALHARIEELEEKQKSDFEYLRDTFDRIDDDITMVEIWEDRIILPALLLLAGHGHRREIESMLSVAEKEGDNLEVLERRPNHRKRLAHWQKLAKSIGPAPRYPPPDF